MWKKVLGPTIFVCALWLAISIPTTFYLFWLRDSNERILTAGLPSIWAARQMEAAVWKLHAAFLAAMSDSNDPRAREIEHCEFEFEGGMAAAVQAIAFPEEQPVVECIRDRFANLREHVHRRLPKTGLNTADLAAEANESIDLARSVTESCAELHQVNERLMMEAFERRENLERVVVFLRLGYLVAGPVIGIYAGARIARRMQHSISQIRVNLCNASGNLEDELGTVDLSPDDVQIDLPAINRQVEAIAARIRQVIAELQNVRQQALASERLAAVGEMAAGVAHEIRNPLTSVKLLMQTAPRDTSGIRFEEKKMQIVLDEVSRMEETIQDLLDFARPPELNRIRHDLRDTVQRALNLVEGRAKQQGIVLAPRIGQASLMIDADAEQLKQVFVNLLINGIEATDRAGVLELSMAAFYDGGRRWCTVQISDRGSGMSQEQLNRMFEPFVTTKVRGIGLGLTLSRGILQKHGGRISAVNRPDRGAEFTVQLPLADAAASSDPREVPGAVPLPGASTVSIRMEQKNAEVAHH